MVYYCDTVQLVDTKQVSLVGGFGSLVGARDLRLGAPSSMYPTVERLYISGPFIHNF